MPIRNPVVLVACTIVLGRPAVAFDCVEKKCPEMESCAEAYYHLEVCGEAARDADNDTIPCEALCGKTVDEYRRRRGPALPKDASRVQQLVQPPAAVRAPGTPSASAESQGTFTCAGKRKCGEMGSCAEARFYLSTCGVGSLDRDHDGVPCESLCGGR